MDLCHLHLQPNFKYLRQSNERSEPHHPELKIAVATYNKDRGFIFEDIQDASESTLQTFIDQSNRREQGPEKSDASLELIFAPMSPHLGINLTRDSFESLVEFIGLDPVLAAFLTSSRSCFHCIIGDNGCHSFLFKDYLYALAWTFDTRTLQTRALFTEGVEWRNSSTSFFRDGAFDIPGLSEHHLYHPLSLAMLVLIDMSRHFDDVILDDTNTLIGVRSKIDVSGDIAGEQRAQSIFRRTKTLYSASIQAVRVTQIWVHVKKSLSIAQSVSELFDPRHEHHFAPLNDTAHPCAERVIEGHRSIAASLRQAAHVIMSRIDTTSLSAQASLEQAKFYTEIVIPMAINRSGEDMAEVNRKDAVVMKGIGYLTLLFLPATFFSTLFSMPSLSGPGFVSEQFWVFWAFTIPTTIIVWMVFDWFDNRHLMAVLALLRRNRTKPTSENDSMP
ncbi:hypothetical protein PG984_012026 [Apiospora sp. TS-2023a]